GCCCPSNSYFWYFFYWEVLTNTIEPVSYSTTLVSQQTPAADSCAYSGPSIAIGQMNLSKQLTVLVTLEFRNQAKLDSLLAELQDPFSPEYHKYLTSNQFISEFSPTQYEYGSYLSFFRSQGFRVTMTYADRVSFSISGSTSLIESVFHTQILYYHEPGRTFFAPDIVPSINANFGRILAVSGLSNRFTPALSPLFQGSGSSQRFYGPDFQAAYQLNELYKLYGYPTNET
ncbi:Peptidase S53, propeptide domain protein, partial [mine drainage metagenome]